jgi:hypothetical protein
MASELKLIKMHGHARNPRSDSVFSVGVQRQNAVGYGGVLVT